MKRRHFVSTLRSRIDLVRRQARATLTSSVVLAKICIPSSWRRSLRPENSYDAQNRLNWTWAGILDYLVLRREARC
jgi:hypothetical protein